MRGKNLRSLITLMSFFFLLWFFPVKGEAKEVPLIRVALEKGAATASFQVVSGGYTFTDESSGLPIAEVHPGQVWKVTASGTALLLEGPGISGTKVFSGPLHLQEKDGNKLNLFSHKGICYRGDLVIQNLDGHLLVVNLIDIEKYLYGVVGREMGAGAAPEAYRAQAVVSRSYALSMRGLNPWYDVGVDTGTQVYGGYTGETAYEVSGRNPVIEAVEATRGKVLEYEGKLVQAFFHSNAGGHTEDVENVWLEPRPYLRGVPSPADSYAEVEGGWAAATYRWVKTMTREELEERLGVGRIKEIRVSRWRTRVTRDPVTGKLRREFVPGTRTVSGRATAVTVVGDEGEKSYYRDSIRTPFNLKSTLFDLVFEGQLQVLTLNGEVKPLTEPQVYVLGKGGLVSSPSDEEKYCVLGKNNQKSLRGISFERVIFIGRGCGHGVGLSQWGARGLAVEGYTWRQIVEHYYNQDRYDGKLQVVDDYGL
ncbi:MAG: SpoIID: sproulation stage II protein D, amidase enhancer LytB [Thermoanaerobacterales bacterium 50_218]|nr:MAG: SpoIID: sproulation stage II protein D, amidase enhancer LytB [Thermoanaerobacterales bacterium 50_218]